MKKIPDHLKIVKDSRLEIKKEPDEDQLTFFKEEFEPEEKTDNLFDFNQSEVDYIVSLLNKVIDKTLVNNRVRNMRDIDELYNAVDRFRTTKLKRILEKKEPLSVWFIIMSLIKRLSEIDYRVKKPAYEETLSCIFMEELILTSKNLTPTEWDILFRYILFKDDFANLPVDWLMVNGLVMSMFLSAFSYQNIAYLYSQTLMRKVFAEGIRRPSDISTLMLSDLYHSYLLLAVSNGQEFDHIFNFIGEHRYDYTFFSHTVEFLLANGKLKEAYRLLKDLEKKNTLDNFYKRLCKEENQKIINSIFNFLYHALCLGDYDYFENIFPLYAKFSKNELNYDKLFLLYRSYATSKRIKKYIKYLLSKESPLSPPSRKIVKRIIFSR